MSELTTHASALDAAHYAYRVVWSPDDQEYVATAVEWGAGLSWLDPDATKALEGLRELIRESIADLRGDGRPVPEPFADRAYSGKFQLRLPPTLHRQLAMSAAEEHLSLNQLVLMRLIERVE